LTDAFDKLDVDFVRPFDDEQILVIEAFVVLVAEQFENVEAKLDEIEPHDDCGDEDNRCSA
jgi:hypothetical protein